MLTPPLPGTPLLTRIDGWYGEAIWLLQAMNGVVSPWTHVAMMLDDNEVFEMWSTGARIIPWSEWSQQGFVAQVPVVLTDDQRGALCEEARRRIDNTGYNWDGYFYLVAARLKIPLVTRILVAKMSRHNKQICSHAVVDIYHKACGIHLFDGKRLMYDVVPGHFDQLLNKEAVTGGSEDSGATG